jgi:hypothetical protein
MDFHPDDLAAFNRITGHSRVTDEVKETYALWKLAHDRNKGQGPLGMMMIPMLMSLGIHPPAEPARVGGKVDWTTVSVGHRVGVTTETGMKFGSFMGMRDYCLVAVKVDGDPMIRTYPPVKVALFAGTHAYDPTTPVPVPEERRDPRPPVAEVEEDHDLPTYRPEMDVPKEKDPPKLENKEWYALGAGTPLLVQTDDDLQPAKLVKVGPGDGELTVWVDGADAPSTILEAAVVGA